MSWWSPFLGMITTRLAVDISLVQRLIVEKVRTVGGGRVGTWKLRSGQPVRKGISSMCIL